MPAHEAHAWWAEVEDIRARIEARRAGAEETRDPAPRLLGLEGGRTVRPAAMSHQHLAAVPERSQRRTVRVSESRPPAPRRRPLYDAPAQQQAPAIRRRPERRARPLVANPDRIALWAVLLGLVMLLVCIGSAGAATTLGTRTLKAPMEGRDVRQLQNALRRLSLLDAGATAHFGPLTRRAVVRFQRTRCLTPDGIAGPATIQAIVARTRRCHTAGAAVPGRASVLTHRRVVTWYGPGWYGRSTACGRTLTPRLIGLADRHLPCGTVVHLAHGSRIVDAVVVDRGPYAHGVDYDLTWGAARALGVLAAGRASVRSSH